MRCLREGDFTGVESSDRESRAARKVNAERMDALSCHSEPISLVARPREILTDDTTVMESLESSARLSGLVEPSIFATFALFSNFR